MLSADLTTECIFTWLLYSEYCHQNSLVTASAAHGTGSPGVGGKTAFGIPDPFLCCFSDGTMSLKLRPANIHSVLCWLWNIRKLVLYPASSVSLCDMEILGNWIYWECWENSMSESMTLGKFQPSVVFVNFAVYPQPHQPALSIPLWHLPNKTPFSLTTTFLKLCSLGLSFWKLPDYQSWDWGCCCCVLFLLCSSRWLSIALGFHIHSNPLS